VSQDQDPDAALKAALHKARIAELEASLRELLRVQRESEQLADEAAARALRVAEELRLLKTDVPSTGRERRKTEPT
jgi:hypothetical protein